MLRKFSKLLKALQLPPFIPTVNYIVEPLRRHLSATVITNNFNRLLCTTDVIMRVWSVIDSGSKISVPPPNWNNNLSMEAPFWGFKPDAIWFLSQIDYHQLYCATSKIFLMTTWCPWIAWRSDHPLIQHVIWSIPSFIGTSWFAFENTNGFVVITSCLILLTI